MVVSYIFVVLCLIGGLYANVLPDSIPRCFRNDPNLDECILKATETMRPQLIKDGIPELGVPSVEPYIIPTLSIDQSSKSLTFKMTLNNLHFSGLGSYKFSEMHFDPKTLRITLQNTLGLLNATSDCVFEGKILVIPLGGKGKFMMATLEPLPVQSTIETRLVKIDGVDHLEITNITAEFPQVKVKARFEDFANMRPEIIEALNRVIDENAQQLAAESIGNLREFIFNFMRGLFSGAFSKVPYDELFPVSDKFPPLS